MSKPLHFWLGVLAGVFFGMFIGTLIGERSAAQDLRIGRKEPCMIDVSPATWPEMNNMGVYRWVYECERQVND